MRQRESVCLFCLFVVVHDLIVRVDHIILAALCLAACCLLAAHIRAGLSCAGARVCIRARLLVYLAEYLGGFVLQRFGLLLER